MKKTFLGIATLSVVLLSQCKGTKSGTSDKGNTEALNDQQMKIVETRWPGSSMDEVKQGQSIFLTQCTQCHANQVITDLSEKKWLHEIDEMAPKAKLSAEEKLKLTKYILSYREANSAKSN